MTVRRGTKEFNQALEGAVKVRFFSFYDGFVGRELKEDNPQAVMSTRAYLRELLRQFQFTRLIRVETGKYMLHVHDNEWYEFEIAAPGTGN